MKMHRAFERKRKKKSKNNMTSYTKSKKVENHYDKEGN